MFLQPSEVGFLKHLKEARVPLVEFDFPAKRILNIQSQLEKLISQNYYLNKVRLYNSRVVSQRPNVMLSHAVGKGWIPILSTGVCVP